MHAGTIMPKDDEAQCGFGLGGNGRWKIFVNGICDGKLWLQISPSSNWTGRNLIWF
jgi:hypothetical protein